ncbi:MAG: hypothetical protein II872_03580 [Clostridia bacterium]|nr:hypothetical protein [Clostridia bacterium]
MNCVTKKLNNNLIKLGDLVFYANTNIKILQTVRESVLDDAVNTEIVNQTISLWHMVIRGLRTQIIMDLSKIFDYYVYFVRFAENRATAKSNIKKKTENESKHKKEKVTISIPVTVVMCEQNKHSLIHPFTKIRKEREKDGRALYDDYNTMQKKVCSLLNKAGEHLDELKKLRDKSFAHLDYTTYFRKKEDLFLGMDSIKELAKIAEEIVDIYSNAFFDHSFELYNHTDQKDVRKLFEFARAGFQPLYMESES